MNGMPEGKAIIYCEGAFGTPNGKTAHGLVRRTERYQVLSVIDSRHAGGDAAEILDGTPKRIPVHADTRSAIDAARQTDSDATHFVIGLAPDGGRLPAQAFDAVREAIGEGLNVDSGLHDFLSDSPELVALAEKHGARLRDIRKTPPRSELHFFSGKIEQVDSLKIALLGTDSAVGKRTTAWILVEAIRAAGLTAEMVGTGQTAWMQGTPYCLILDSLINDFVSGEIEHAVWSAWNERHPDAIVIEGQGSLLNPAYPGGFEILAAGRPELVVLQHAPARKDYDGFPGYPIHPLKKQIEAVELVSSKPVAAITINHEDIPPQNVPEVCRAIEEEIGRPVVDVLLHGAGRLVEAVRPFLKKGP